MWHKCICICFELVLRIVLQKWVETIYMKLYCINWERRDDGEKKTYASQTEKYIVVLSIFLHSGFPKSSRWRFETLGILLN